MKKLYGPQTQLATENFPISGWTVPPFMLFTLAAIKKHAALVNAELKLLPKGHARAIAAAVDSLQIETLMDQFPVDIFQTGSGTSTNMNMNEVLATLASTKSRKVHPNDHVNCCQSSNDVFPTAIQIACAADVRWGLLPALAALRKQLQRKGKQFQRVIKTARTHLMDAVPMRLGDEFLGFAALISAAETSLKGAITDLSVLPLGGTAAGTGLNAHPRFAKMVVARLKKESGLALKEAPEHVSAQSCPLALLSLSSALRQTASALHKVANDIRHLSSGPIAGLSELQLPALQAGSSIMPGKVNPVLCESVMQVSMYVTGADATVQEGVKHGSQFELNTAYPVMAYSLFESIRLLTNVSAQFSDKCVQGITANTAVIADRSARNPMLVTALNPLIGYDQAAKIAKEAIETGETILAVAKRRTKIPPQKLKMLLDPKRNC